MSFDPPIHAPFAGQAYGTFEVRQLAARDLAAVAAYYLSLDEAGRVTRFHTPLDDTAILRYVNNLDTDQVTFVGAVDRASGLMIGVAEYHPAAGDDAPEITVSVAPGARAALAATQLLGRILESAALRGVDGVSCDFRHEDTFIITLLRQFGAELDLMQGRASLAWTEPEALGRAA